MGLGFGGLKSLVQSAAATIANLVGQNVVANTYTATSTTADNYTANAGSGIDAFQAATNGARIHFGAGASDYASSDGTTITFAAPITVTGAISSNNNISAGAGSTVSGGAWSGSTVYSVVNTAMTIGGWIADGAGAIAITMKARTALTIAGAQIIAWYKDDGTTKVAAITKDGAYNPDFTDDSATAGNRTVNKPAGLNAIAALAATCVITNSVVKATSIVLCVLQEADATATTILRVVPAAGSFTLTVNAAATADTTFGWIVFNGV